MDPAISPETLIMVFLSLLFSLSVHEAAHAAMATSCGDDTARSLGRLTLNPLVHIDPLGTILFPLAGLYFGGFIFGWAKPVPFNPRKLKDIRRDPLKIALAGPASNLLLAILFILIARCITLVIPPDDLPPLLQSFLFLFIRLNIVLVLLNLLPVPPLDGHYVVMHFLSPTARAQFQQMAPMLLIVAMIAAMRIFPVILGPIDVNVLRITGLI